ncbi:MAG: hypothetical protein ACOCR6_01730, partial [archaeon]
LEVGQLRPPARPLTVEVGFHPPVELLAERLAELPQGAELVEFHVALLQFAADEFGVVAAGEGVPSSSTSVTSTEHTGGSLRKGS